MDQNYYRSGSRRIKIEKEIDNYEDQDIEIKILKYD